MYITKKAYHKVSNNARKTATYERKPKKSDANLCSVVGHDWKKTSSDVVQICDRKSCCIVRQKIKGHWRYVRKVPTNVKNKKAYAVNTATLWNEVLG